MPGGLAARLATGLRRHLLGAAVLLAVVLLVLWPLPITDGALGHSLSDLADHYWGTWWFGHELLSGRAPLVTELTHFPNPRTLWTVDPIGATIALALRPLGFPAAWNGMLLVQLWLAGLAAYAAAVDLLESRWAGVFTGAVVVGSPYLLGLVHSGLAEYAGLALPVLYTWSLVRTLGVDPRGRPPLRYGALLSGLLLVGCTAQAFYYGAFGAVLAGCFALSRDWRVRLPRLAGIAVVYCLLAVPPMVLLWRTLKGGDAAVGDHNAPGWELVELPAVDLLTYVVGGDYRFPDTVAMGNPGVVQVNYIGWVVLVLALVGLVRSPALRRLAVPVGFYGLLALGPRLAVAKTVLSVAGTSVYLPLALLYFPGSPFRMVHHPYRMVAFLLLPLGLLGASAIRRLHPGLRVAAIAGLLAEALLLSPAPWPLPTTATEPPALPGPAIEGPRLDWPVDASSWNRRYLLWQVSHHQPIPYGVNVFLDEDLRRDPLVHRLVYTLDDPLARAANRDVAYRGRVLLEPEPGATRLAELGFRSIVVHRDGLSSTEWPRVQTLLQAAYGPPVGLDEHVAVWQVTAQEEQRIPGAARRRAHQEE